MLGRSIIIVTVFSVLAAAGQAQSAAPSEPSALAAAAPSTSHTDRPPIRNAMRISAPWRSKPDVAKPGRKPHLKDGQSVTISGSGTGPKGQEHSASATISRENGVLIRDAMRSGPNGTTKSHETWTKEGGTLVHDRQTTLPSGKSTSLHARATKNDDGTISREAVRVGPDGKSVEIDSTITKTDSGRTVESTITGPDGKAATRTATYTRDANAVTREAATTGPNGKTVKSHDTWTREKTESGATIKHEGTTLRPDGKSSTRSSTLERDAHSLTRESSRTDAKGRTHAIKSQRTIEREQGATAKSRIPASKAAARIRGDRPKR